MLLIDFLKEEIKQNESVALGAEYMEKRSALTTEEKNEIINRALKFNDQLHERLHADPALAHLVGVIVTVLLSVEQMISPDEAKKEGMVLTITNMIKIWENANNRYNEQFKPKA